MKTIIAALFLVCTVTAMAQTDSVRHISKLEIERRGKEVFAGGDSSMVLHIDTLIMKDRAYLQFFGKKDVKLKVNHAIIHNRGYIFGTDSKNNGTNFDIDIRFDKLGSLHVLAGGLDANNGFRTHPNGNGGNVTLTYAHDGVIPQTENRKEKQYLHIDTRAGGYRVNPQADLYNIYSRIDLSIVGRPLGNLPQGTIYSGSPGVDGKSNIKAKE